MDRDDYSTGELSRRFTRLENDTRDSLRDIRESVRGSVRKDVYHAEQALILARIKAIEDDRDEDRERTNRAIQLGVGGLVFPIIVGVVVGVLLLLFSKGG